VESVPQGGVKMKYQEMASEILSAVGGKDNVSAAAHCSTRLRLVLNDEKKVNQEVLDKMEFVKGTFSTGGQFQIILGAGIVNNVYNEFSGLAGIEEMSTSDVKAASDQNLNLIQRAVKLLSDVFVPIIPAIVAGGLLMGLNNLLTAQDLFFSGMSVIEAHPQIADLADFINIIANAPFVYLPVLIGFSAAKRFGGNAYLGASLGMLMVHPDLLNAWALGGTALEDIPVWSIFGFEIAKIGYQGTVLPILASAYILATLEKFFRKRIHTSLDNLLTPLLTIMITAVLTFTVVGPIMRSAGDGLTIGLIWLYDTTGFIGGSIFGFLYAPIVITGMHHSFMAIETQLLAEMVASGGSFIFPIAAMSNVAQGAATLAVFFLTKDAKTKGIASASGISALLGITEPAMFGINLKLKYPFIGAIIGAGIGSGFVTLFKVKAVAMGAAGIPGIISINPSSMGMYVVGMIITFVVAFAMTVVLSKRSAK